MSKNFVFFIIVFAQMIAFNGFAQESPSAAVMKFARSKNVSSEFSETVSAIVRNEVQQLEKYDVVNKFPIEFQDILDVLDCKIESNACLLKVAKQLKASVLIFGDIKDSGDRVQIIVNVFDVEKEKIDMRLVRFFDRKKDPVVAFRKELQYFFGTKKPDEPTSIVEIDSNIRKATVYVNGKFVGQTPLRRPNMKPGTYQIRVEALGYMKWETRIKLTTKSGDLPVFAQLQKGKPAAKTVVKKPMKALKKHDTTFVPDPIEDSSLNWAAVATTGVGLVAMGTSVIFGLQFEETEDLINDKRSKGILSRTEFDELASKGNTQETVHFILLGTGAAITTVGIVWFAISPSFSEQAIRIEVSPQNISASLSF